MFYLLKPKPKKGYEWVKGRLTKIESGTNRPGNTWVEVWRNYGKRARIDCIADWGKTKKR